MFQLTRSVTWQALERLRDKTANDRIRDYFTSDPQRFETSPCTRRPLRHR